MKITKQQLRRIIREESVKPLGQSTIEKTIENFSFNSGQSSQHRWGRGRPIIDYHFDESNGMWMYTATIPGDSSDSHAWEDIGSAKGEDLVTFLTRVKERPRQLNLGI
jgi:hypothetical protein